MSTRKITDQQFSEGTTVDGDRLDQALQDTEKRLNSIPAGDLETRYTQTQLVAGWTALQTVANQNQAPWLRFHNTTDDRQGTDGEILHPFRVKGTQTSGYTTAWTAAGDDTYWAWTTSFYFEDPCIIDAVDMLWHTADAGYVTNLNPQLNFVNPSTSDWYSQGIQCSVVVDDPQATEEPIRNSLVLQLKKLYMGAEALGTDATLYSGFASDMKPSLPTTQQASDLWLQRRNIQLHIPANSRVRFQIVLDGTDLAARPLDPQSYQRGAPNFVVTLLEPVRK